MSSDVLIRDNTRRALEDITRLSAPRFRSYLETIVEIARDLSPFDTGNNRDSISAADRLFSSSGTRGVSGLGSALFGATGDFKNQSPPGIEAGEAWIYTQSGYGGTLEVGSAKRAARPYIAPAVQRAGREFLRSGKF